jgi:alpha-glucosidase
MESYMNINHDYVAEQKFPDVIETWKQVENAFYFQTKGNTKLEVKVVSDSIVRFRFSPYGNFQKDFSYSGAHAVQLDFNDLKITEKEECFVVSTALLDVEIQKEKMLIRVFNKEGVVLSEDEKGYHWEDHRKYGGEIVYNTRKMQAGEHFYGLGDKSTDIDLRGKRFENWGKDTYGFGKDSDPLYKNIPFFIGLHHKLSYGIFFDNSFRSYYDFGAERQNANSFWAHGGEMNYYFIYGPEMFDVVKKYSQLTGVPELPPLWTLGFHQCKWSYYPESQVRDITSTFRKKKIPCDAIYLDIDYMDGFRCFTWSPEHFPHPKQMVSDLSKEGFKTVVIIDPGIKIDPNYSVYTEALEKGFFCRRMDGPLMKGAVWPGDCNFPDFTNPDVRVWWAGLFKELIEDIGVKGVWNDMNEPAVFEVETFPYDVRHDYDGDPCSHRKAHNVYGMQMARATYDGVKKFRNGERPFVITRSGYAGLQKYTSVWTGDNIANWEHLVIANNQCQRLSVSGISFCGSDIGGFIGQPTGELFIRWIQLGIFHPFCRVHSSGDHGEQEPWSFGVEFETLSRKFIELRYQLLPYIYTTFYQHVQSGMPFLRPLPFIAQHDLESYARQDEFMMGDSILVCPVLGEKLDGRWLYLPEGTWYYWWDDKTYKGKQEVWADAALDRVPMYIRGGAVLPIAPIQQYVGEFKINELSLHTYYCKGTVQSSLYDDKGDGYQYQEGQYIYRTFDTKGTDKSFEIYQSSVGDYESDYSTYRLILHGMPFKIKTIQVDGKEVEFDVLNPEVNIVECRLSVNFKSLIVK